MSAPVITAFGSPKGGVYKSTLAVHYAALRAMEGARVLLVDADPNESTIAYVTAASLTDRLDTLTVARSEVDALPRLRAAEAFDLIVIDLPGAKGDELAHLIQPGNVDLFVTPTGADIMDAHPLMPILEVAQVPTLTVFTKTAKYRTGEVEQWREQFTAAGFPTAHTHVRALSAWSRARMAQRLVTDMPSASEAKADIYNLTREIKEATS